LRRSRRRNKPVFHVKPKQRKCGMRSSAWGVGGMLALPSLRTPHFKLRIKQRPLLQWVDYQAANELWIEVRALGGHAFAVLADLANMLDRGRHDQGAQREPASLSHDAGGVARGGVALFEAFN